MSKISMESSGCAQATQARRFSLRERLFVKRLSGTESIYLRISGYQDSDAASLQRAGDNVEIANRLNPLFPSPYKLSDAEFWIKLNKLDSSGDKLDISGGWKQHKLDPAAPYNLPMVSVRRISMDRGKDSTTTTDSGDSDSAHGGSNAAGGDSHIASDSNFTSIIREDVIGNIGFVPRRGDRDAGAFEIGYWLSPLYWGQGLMKACLPLFCDWTLELYPDQIRRLDTLVADDNPGSWKASQAAGFSLRTDLEEEVEAAHGVCREMGLPTEIRLRRYSVACDSGVRIPQRSAALPNTTGTSNTSPAQPVVPTGFLRIRRVLQLDRDLETCIRIREDVFGAEAEFIAKATGKSREDVVTPSVRSKSDGLVTHLLAEYCQCCQSNAANEEKKMNVIPVGTLRVMLQRGPAEDLDFFAEGSEGIIIEPELAEIALGKREQDQLYYGRVSQIAVLPEYRKPIGVFDENGKEVSTKNLNVGRFLMEAAEKWVLEEIGIGLMKLHAYLPAVPFYQAVGYKSMGEPFFPGGEGDVQVHNHYKWL